MALKAQSALQAPRAILANQGCKARKAHLARQVRELFDGFGTCSISEPVGGLLDLGLLPEELR